MLAVLALAGCGGDDGKRAARTSGTLTVYSGREEELVAPLFERFEEETGIDVEVRYGDSAELAATIAEEGDNSPADVFFAQDPGSLGAVEDAARRAAGRRARPGRRALPRRRRPLGRHLRPRPRDRLQHGRALRGRACPDSVFDLTDPKWKGKIGLAPDERLLPGLRDRDAARRGRRAHEGWLEDLKANDPKFYEKNTPIVEAVASGEIELGLVNHYYLYLVKEEQPDAPIANYYLPGDDPGALVSVAGAGILDGAEHADAAERFVEFLLADEQQRFYTEEAEEAEIPLVEGIAPREGVPTLDELSGRGPDVDLSAFGEELERTLELLNETGYTS